MCSFIYGILSFVTVVRSVPLIKMFRLFEPLMKNGLLEDVAFTKCCFFGRITVATMNERTSLRNFSVDIPQLIFFLN